MLLTTSIVLYNNDRDILKQAIDSVLESRVNFDFMLYLIDNSPTDELKDLVVHQKVVYIHNPSNPGFGAAHNIAMNKSIQAGAKYHFVINPDVVFGKDVIQSMFAYMDSNPDIGMMMPQILNEDGTSQNLPKLLPSPYSILMRKLRKPAFLYNDFINKYELRFVPKDKIYNAPVLSGCFTLMNLKAVKEIGMYDDAYFMYFEDWDLSRRMHKKYKTVYYPLVSVYHGYESGANKSSKLFRVYLKSAFTYFSKWGWFFDTDRRRMNNDALSQF